MTIQTEKRSGAYEDEKHRCHDNGSNNGMERYSGLLEQPV